MELKEVKQVISKTKTILKHHRELTIAKGEHFNLFSVLNIETKENKTHSAFIAELLNPKGIHGLGTVFLDLFIETIRHNTLTNKKLNTPFQSNTAKVSVEHFIGVVDLKKNKGEDPKKATGGRIDIYIKDKYQSISIENKIHASDQEAQIQRYFNYRPKTNTVYYLTLNGEDPDEKSSLSLNSGVDFYNISYRRDIINWLELCLKEVPNFTSLREAINQYILLIKKLTHILNKKEQQELTDVIVKNLEASKYIADNYQNIVNDIRERFRQDIVIGLNKILENKGVIAISDKTICHKYSKIWIHFINRQDIPFSYGIESFSAKGHDNGNLFVGLYGYNNIKCTEISEPNTINKHWQHVQFLKIDNNVTDKANYVNLGNSNLLNILSNHQSDIYKNLLAGIVDQIVEFVEQTNKYVLEFK